MRRLVFVLALSLAGCGSCAKDKPATPALQVSVERPGKAAFTIDGAALAAHPADLNQPPWTAWKLRTLVPEWDDHAPVDVVDDEGFRSPLLRAGEAPGELESVLALGPEGETRIVRIAPGKPITAHRGETRKDAGRVRHVAKLVFVDAAEAGAVAGPAVSIKILVGTKESAWTRAELAKVEPIVLMSKDGDGERDAWPLRELAAKLVAPNAMPSEVIGEEPKTMRIDAAKWNDAALVPVIRANRRGRLKLVWLDAKTKEEDHDEPQQKGVREVHFP